MWNTFGPVETFAAKNAILNDWCEKEGRDPKAVERTVMIDKEEIADVQSYLDAGADHIIIGGDFPFDMGSLKELLAQRDA